MVRLLTVAVVGMLMFLAAPLHYDYHAQPPTTRSLSAAHSMLERAILLKNSIANHPPATRTETDYLDLIGVYQRALRLDEDHSLGDLALLGQAETYRQMGVQFQKQRYFYSAIQSYTDILQQYPVSAHTTRSLVGTAQIYEQDLQDKNEAARAYAEIITRYPSSVSAREAQASLARLGYTVGERDPLNVIEAHSQDDTDGIATVSQVRHFSGPDYARVILDVSVMASYEKSLNGSTLIVRVPQAKLSSLLPLKQIATGTGGMLKQVRLSSSTKSVEVAIDCTQIRDFAIFALDNPPRIVADIRGSRSIAEEAEIIANSSTPTVQGAQHTVDGSITLMRALGLKVKRIVIDPGHGGSDTGAMGKDGIYEKDVVLDIGLRLRAAIQQQMKDVEVIMTRDTDRYIPLEERTAVANTRQADLFISIHANSSPSNLASGVETYFLSLEATKEELEVATRENATTSRNAGELQSLLQRIVLDNKVSESRDFAQHVQSSMVNGLRKVSARSSFDRGVKKAPFVVLLGTNMPSVLAEVSFISHPKDADALRTAEFRQQIAESLFDGIKNYVQTLSKGPALVGGQ
ncbi:MAG: N-acetylmuramoyl-L-alanine amidase [Blastocatellia bacterium]|nr:N-acetylmuramoyl-L-alanine amidase [Blastocatellia bacterium]